MASLPSISLCLLFLTFLSKTHLTLTLITNKPLNHSRQSHPLHSITGAHELLQLYGLPMGLIPLNVRSHTFDVTTGSLYIELTSTCNVQFEKLDASYDKDIYGKLSYGGLHDVSGFQAKELLIWSHVTKIEQLENSDKLRFFFDVLFKDLPADQFEEIPICESKVSQRSSFSSI